jgi:Domain of unknown function (DUF4129)
MAGALMVGAATAVAWAAPLVPGAEEARRLAEQELARQVYRDARPGLAELIWDWLVEVLANLLDGVGHLDARAAVGLLALLLVAAAVLVLRRFRLRTPEERHPPELFDGGRGLSAAEHRQRAAEAAARGDYSDASREVFRAVVRAAEERAVLDSRPGRTADEAAEELGAPFPEYTARLRQAAGLFDAVMYGGTAATQNSYLHLLELESELRQSRPVQDALVMSNEGPAQR